jgi:hypothetical protein
VQAFAHAQAPALLRGLSELEALAKTGELDQLGRMAARARRSLARETCLAATARLADAAVAEAVPDCPLGGRRDMGPDGIPECNLHGNPGHPRPGPLPRPDLARDLTDLAAILEGARSVWIVATAEGRRSCPALAIEAPSGVLADLTSRARARGIDIEAMAAIIGLVTWRTESHRLLLAQRSTATLTDALLEMEIDLAAVGPDSLARLIPRGIEPPRRLRAWANREGMRVSIEYADQERARAAADALGARLAMARMASGLGGLIDLGPRGSLAALAMRLATALRLERDGLELRVAVIPVSGGARRAVPSAELSSLAGLGVVGWLALAPAPPSAGAVECASLRAATDQALAAWMAHECVPPPIDLSELLRRGYLSRPLDCPEGGAITASSHGRACCCLHGPCVR